MWSASEATKDSIGGCHFALGNRRGRVAPTPLFGLCRRHLREREERVRKGGGGIAVARVRKECNASGNLQPHPAAWQRYAWQACMRTHTCIHVHTYNQTATVLKFKETKAEMLLFSLFLTATRQQLKQKHHPHHHCYWMLLYGNWNVLVIELSSWIRCISGDCFYKLICAYKLHMYIL